LSKLKNLLTKEVLKKAKELRRRIQRPTEITRRLKDWQQDRREAKSRKKKTRLILMILAVVNMETCLLTDLKGIQS
jgi:hypothetical protein